MIKHEPEHIYRGFTDHLTSSKLRVFRQSPAIYKHQEDKGWPHTDSPSMLLGRAVHTMALEGDEAYGENWLVTDGPKNSKTGSAYGKSTKAYSEWEEQIRNDNPNKQLIPTETHKQAYEIAHALRKDKRFADAREGSQSEITIRGEMFGRKCQSRLDLFKGGTKKDPTCMIYDLKTTSNLDEFAKWSIHKFGYVYQLAFYIEMLEKAAQYDADGMIIAVETAAPYRIGCWQVDDALMLNARDKVEAEIRHVSECEETGKWPTGFEDVRLIDRLY